MSSSEATTSTTLTTAAASAATASLSGADAQHCERPFTYISHILRENKTGVYFVKVSLQDN